MSNPYTLTFGKHPTEYINRGKSIDEVKNVFLEFPPRYQTYLIRGVRGSGKTVLMTSISNEISSKKDWVSVDLNATQDLIEDLSYRLGDVFNSLSDVMDRGLDISVLGFGVGIGGKENGDSVSRCETVLKELKKKNKKLLITIDEVCNDRSMKRFASQFQIWLRKDYPIFLLMTGLYENITSIQNDPQLTFLLRTPRITTNPLSISLIARQYEITLKTSPDTALMLAKNTKGYAFAFQALGMLYYDNPNEDIEIILKKLDSFLDEYVYRKIWSELSVQDQNVLLALSDTNPCRVKDICAKTNMTSSTFSKYRERLVNKGLISTEQHGYVNLALPRFKSVCKYYTDL